jgi:hypothetical protein
VGGLARPRTSSPRSRRRGCGPPRPPATLTTSARSPGPASSASG